jgi:hypothetical protein
MKMVLNGEELGISNFLITTYFMVLSWHSPEDGENHNFGFSCEAAEI